MLNRRQWMRALGSLALAGAAGGPTTAFAQQRRGMIQVGNRTAVVVDMHAHCVIPAVAEQLPQAGRPSVIAPPDLELTPRRMAIMDERGIDIQALSINTYWWYAQNNALAAQVVKMHDEALAEWCAQHPERFVALSSVALQDPELAARQLEYAVTELGFRGASIGGHVNNESPSAPKYDAFWAAAEALDVPVFMHPNNAENIASPGALGGRGALGNIVGNPLETTVFLSRMIFDGTFDRFPGLRVCAAHGGGFLTSYLGRTEVACAVRGDADCQNTKLPSAYFRDQILVDSMVFTPEGLRHLVAETGPGQVVYGSDIPYIWPDTIDLIAESPYLDIETKLAILGGNLLRLLRIDV